MSYDLTPERLEEIERAARAVQERHTPGSEWRVVAFQDPETVLALCRMARRALGLERGWRPIDTAPKDRYIVITDGKVMADVAIWQDERPARGAYLARPAGWFNVSRSRIHEPTHWLPLPEWPEQAP